MANMTRVDIAKNIHGDRCITCNVLDGSFIARAYTSDFKEVYVDWVSKVVYSQTNGEIIGHLSTLDLIPVNKQYLYSQLIKLVANSNLEPICHKCLNSNAVAERRKKQKRN